MRASQKTTTNIFFTFTFLDRKNYILLGNILVYIVTFALQFLHVTVYQECSNNKALIILS